jgi:hypothetical protein
VRCRFVPFELDFAGRAMEVEAKGSRAPRARARYKRHVIGHTFVYFFIEIPHKALPLLDSPTSFPLLDRHEVWKEDFRTLSPLFALLASF